MNTEHGGVRLALSKPHFLQMTHSQPVDTIKRYVNSFQEEFELMNLGRKGEESDLEFG